MASKKRNSKTRPSGEDVGDYTPPDHPQNLIQRAGEDTEVIEVVSTANGEEIQVRQVDANSADEGDARTIASEGGDDAGTDGNATAGAGARGVQRGKRPLRRGGARADSDDGDGYSARVRKRIAREQANTNRARALLEQTQAQLSQERAARQAQDERIARIERAQTDIAGNSDVKSIEAQIASLLPQIAAATEAGETAKALELQTKIGDLQADLKVLKYDLKKQQEARDAAAAAARTRSTQQPTDTDPNADPIVKEVTNRFMTANRHWWNRAKFKEAKQDCIDLDSEILAEITSGDLDIEKYSDEHFAELADRLHEEHPDLDLHDLEGEPYQFDEDDEDSNTMRDERRDRGQRNGRPQQDTRTNGRSPTGGIGRGGRRQASPADLARSGKVELTTDDFATMRTYGLDPNKAEDKKYFAKERMRTILTEDRRNGGDR